MSVNPTVSFVVPCYKFGHLLAECVSSILAQDYKDFEIVIMDNCSPDNTPEVAQSFHDPRVKYFRNESNLGHVANFNKGINTARGKYVWLVCADDKLRSPHALGRYVDLMERNERVGFVFCRALELRDGRETGIGRWADCGEEDRIWTDKAFFLHLIEANCIVASSVLVRKECYEKSGLYQPDLTFATDWYLWCMLAMHYGVGYLAEPMVSCRFHEESLTSQYSHDHAKICIGDEIAVLLRVGNQAGRAELPSLQRASREALIRRAVRLLSAGLQGQTPGMSQVEFEQVLKDRIGNPKSSGSLRAAVYTVLADELFWGGDQRGATQFYREGLTASPWRIKTLAKFLLIHTGAMGTRVRKLTHRDRHKSIQVWDAK